MNRHKENGHLELEVTDFGPITEASLDLRPLTVFIGPSNTGKSYLAILIYALHRFISATYDQRGWGYNVRQAPGLSRRIKRIFSDNDEEMEKVIQLARILVDDSGKFKASKFSMPQSITELLRISMRSWSRPLSDEIMRCFGLGDFQELRRKGSAVDPRVVIRSKIADSRQPEEQVFTLSQEPTLQAAIPSVSLTPLLESARTKDRDALFLQYLLTEINDRKPSKKLQYFVISSFIELTIKLVTQQLFDPLDSTAYYLPADRTGLMNAHSVVVSALIARAPMTGLRPAARTPMLTGVLADFIEQLIGIDTYDDDRSTVLRDLGSDIEKHLLGGSVRFDRSTAIDYPRVGYRPRGWKKDIALANASSMVSELAPVVLYLRHVIEPGNVLIVEEPESHLHPGKQVEFIRKLAQLVKAGVRVVVTTHSEWLLEELTNIVNRSKLPESEPRDSVALGPNDVGIWLFEQKSRSKGSVVKNVDLGDPDNYPSVFGDVAASLHNDWADIANRTRQGS